ncbi:hypothetical protein HKK80_08825 [Halonotius sp. F2-221B]|uniref:hypothetical protein n=1 Tax=Halonotius sp. F2-221B TaxID=2731620 RepID=UPI00398B679C
MSEERSEPREFCERSEQNLERRAQASLSVVDSVEGFLSLPVLNCYLSHYI